MKIWLCSFIVKSVNESSSNGGIIIIAIFAFAIIGLFVMAECGQDNETKRQMKRYKSVNEVYNAVPKITNFWFKQWNVKYRKKSDFEKVVSNFFEFQSCCNDFDKKIKKMSKEGYSLDGGWNYQGQWEKCMKKVTDYGTKLTNEKQEGKVYDFTEQTRLLKEILGVVGELNDFCNKFADEASKSMLKWQAETYFRPA
ncbi:hypothetical protein SAMN04487761_101103 [Lachnospiraceae bacterium C7]|nr:hypothetical protein SAMN04487761_101103 [Lachnospiraceae bacterium C7]